MIEIRQAKIEDLDAVTTLFEQYRAFYKCDANPEHARAFLADRINQNESIIYLAYHKDGKQEQAIGFVQLYPLFSSTAMKKLWLLNDLYVQDEHRRHKVGEALIDRASELVKATKARGMFLETQATNTIAQRLYEKKGFILNTNYFYGLDLE